jgi:hypothetical protein
VTCAEQAVAGVDAESIYASLTALAVLVRL